jgi:uncharacterized membrane protein YqiK
MASFLIPAGVILFLLLTLGLMFARLYKKTTKEMSFVRTGFGGEKIVMNGGGLVLPVLHDVTEVNMKTLQLTVTRQKAESLITKDKMRVDIIADFFVRVKQDKESISKAAQTLGAKTLDPRALKDLIESKFVDALRAVAASMNMDDLHTQRQNFVQEVQNVLHEDLLKNGLELETVSLTTLDQTPLEYFNENNAFDAEGMTVLTQVIQERKKRRNDIERKTEIEIQQKDLETRKQALELDQQKQFAEAQQAAEVAEEQAKRRREAEEARITSEKAIEEAEIEKQKVLEAKEIEKNKALEASRIDKEKTIALAEQVKQIEISEKSQQESEAKALANEKKALEVASAEKVITSRETEEANRNKALALIKAEEEAEEIAIGKKVAATAEKEAAQDYAEAKKITATANADAIKIEADAQERAYAVEAEGKEKLNAAENVLSAEIIQMRIQEALIANLPKIVEQVVAPMQNIDSIRIVDMGGAGGAGGNAVVNGGGTNGSLSDQLVNSALKYQTHAPVVKDLVNSLGLDISSVEGLTAPLTGMVSPAAAEAIVGDTTVEEVPVQEKPVYGPVEPSVED